MQFFSRLLFLILSFGFVYNPSAQGATTGTANSISFDGERIPFEQTEEGKQYHSKFGALPPLVDKSGYPQVDNRLKQQSLRLKSSRPSLPIRQPILKPGPKVLPVKKNPNVTYSILKSLFDFFIGSAHAFDYDPSVPELVNCRPSIPDPSLPEMGYFKVYFQDIADSTSVGYDHPTLGYARQLAVCEVLQDIATIIKLDQTPNLFPDLFFAKDWPDSMGYALGIGSPYFGLNQSAAGVDTGTLHRHIVSRIDPTPGAGDFDGIIHTNWSYPYSVDSTATPQLNASNFDLKTMIRHEILHAMGFMSRLPSIIGTTNIVVSHNLFDENFYSPTYPFFLMTQPLSPLLQVPVGAPSVWFVNNAGIYQGRKNYVGAPLDNARPLFTPNPLKYGSSLSHFDMDRLPPGSSDVYVMHPALPMGVSRGVHTHEKEVLCHLGYQVIGMTGCSGPTPVARDDIGTITSANFCINFLDNDISYSGGSLSLQTLELLEPQTGGTWSPIIYYQNSSCLGLPFNSLSAATVPIKSIKISTSTPLPMVRIKYRIKDSVSGRISEPALIGYSSCTVAADEYVCNGDFEMGGPIPGYFAFGSPNMPLWGKALGSPDLVTKNASGSHNYLNLPSGGVDMVDAGQFAVFFVNFYQAGTINDEKPTTRLKSPLTVGQCYKISFDILMMNMSTVDVNISEYNIMGSFSTSDMSIPLASYPASNPVLDAAVPVLNQPMSLYPTQWSSVSKYFVPSQPFEYLTIHNPHPTQYGFGIYNWADNISVKKVASNFCSTSSISGVVYNDINMNGTMNFGESVVANVQVGLFHGQTGALVDEAITDNNGLYKFYSVANFNNYYTALRNENIIQTISEPATNNLLSGHQHARNIPFTNGGVVTGENFGVFLEGQVVLPPGPGNIVCASAPPASSFSTLLNPSNNVPLYSCYAALSPDGTRSCIYNLANPATSTSVWSAACPAATAGTTCCGWYDACPPATITGVVTNASSGANGGIALTVSGTGPYTYLWSNGQTTQNLTNVVAGEYTVTVKNANGCQWQKVFRVHSQMQITLAKNQACNVSGNSITATVSGGAPAYTYRWYKNGVMYPSVSAPFTGATPTGLVPANYYVVVTDVNGQVTQSAPVTIDAYTAPSIAVTKTDAIATAYNNGTIKVTVTGGVAPFNYFFTGLNAMSVSAQASPYTRTGLTGNNDVGYGVFVYDSKNCHSNTVSNIKVLNKLTATSKIVADCSSGSALPMIVVTPVGGHGNYSFQWMQGTSVLGNGMSNASLSGTAAGTYLVTVTDQSTPTPQSVQLTVSMPSTAPVPHSVSATVVNTTNGLNNGSVTINTTAGLGPYTYSYVPGSTFANILANTHTQSGLAPGNYTATVKTNYGCSVPKSFTILKSAVSTSTIIK